MEKKLYVTVDPFSVNKTSGYRAGQSDGMEYLIRKTIARAKSSNKIDPVIRRFEQKINNRLGRVE